MRIKQIGNIFIALITTIVMAWSPSLGATPIAAAADESNWIVLFQPGTTKADRALLARGAGANLRYNYDVVDAVAVHASAKAIAALTKQQRVASVVPDRVVTVLLDPDPANALGKPANNGKTGSTGQTTPSGVKRIGADQVWSRTSGPATGSGVGVAVVDTGIDFNHGDLQPLGTQCFTAYNSCQDDNGHGTHVSGIIAARNNQQDVVGVAPGATLYAVKVLDAGGSGLDSDIIAGLDWVLTNYASVSPNIRVVNMSLGRLGTLDDNPALRAAVKALYDSGITVVVSAGNDYSKEVSQTVPATYPEVLALASTSAVDGVNRCRSYNGLVKVDTASYFTTDGKFDPSTGIGVTISAPGEDREDISRACFLESVGILSTRLGGGTTNMSGTSMSSPHVAGVVALMWQNAGGSLLPETVRGKIRISAVRVGEAPLDSPSRAYTYDGEREGILWAPGATN